MARVVLVQVKSYTMKAPLKRLHVSQGILLLMLLLLFSCRQAVKGPEPPLPPVEALISHLPDLPDSFTGSGSFSISRNGVSGGSFQGLLVYRKPDMMRFMLLSSLGMSVYEVIFRNGALLFLDPSRRTGTIWKTGITWIFPSKDIIRTEGLHVEKGEDGYLLLPDRPVTGGTAAVYRFRKDLSWAGADYTIPDGLKVSLNVMSVSKGIPSLFSISVDSMKVEAVIEKFSTRRPVGEWAFTIPEGFTIREAEGAPF